MEPYWKLSGPPYENGDDTDLSTLGWRVYSAIEMESRVLRLYGAFTGGPRIDNRIMMAEVTYDGKILKELCIEQATCEPDWGKLFEISVLRDGGNWAMYFWDQYADDRSGLCLQTSTDGIRWKRSKFNPIITGISDAVSVFRTLTGDIHCYQQMWYLDRSPGPGGFTAFINGKEGSEKSLIRRGMGMWYGKRNARMTFEENLVGPVILPSLKFVGNAHVYRMTPFIHRQSYRAIVMIVTEPQDREHAKIGCHMVKSDDGIEWEYSAALPPGLFYCRPILLPDGRSLWFEGPYGKSCILSKEHTDRVLG